MKVKKENSGGSVVQIAEGEGNINNHQRILEELTSGTIEPETWIFTTSQVTMIPEDWKKQPQSPNFF